MERRRGKEGGWRDALAAAALLTVPCGRIISMLNVVRELINVYLRLGNFAPKTLLRNWVDRIALANSVKALIS